jgi:hypothetical protein
VFTEGADGLHRDILATAAHLSHAVDRLVKEHDSIDGVLTDLLARSREEAGAVDVDSIRDKGTLLLGYLVRHRQRGADLVFEAYQADIGGET